MLLFVWPVLVLVLVDPSELTFVGPVFVAVLVFMDAAVFVFETVSVGIAVFVSVGPSVFALVGPSVPVLVGTLVPLFVGTLVLVFVVTPVLVGAVPVGAVPVDAEVPESVFVGTSVTIVLLSVIAGGVMMVCESVGDRTLVKLSISPLDGAVLASLVTAGAVVGPVIPAVCETCVLDGGVTMASLVAVG